MRWILISAGADLSKLESLEHKSDLIATFVPWPVLQAVPSIYLSGLPINEQPMSCSNSNYDTGLCTLLFSRINGHEAGVECFIIPAG